MSARPVHAVRRALGAMARAARAAASRSAPGARYTESWTSPAQAWSSRSEPPRAAAKRPVVKTATKMVAVPTSAT